MAAGALRTLWIAAAVAVIVGPGCRRGAPSSVALPPELPRLALSPAQAAAVVRLALSRPDDDDPTRRTTIVLERGGDGWRLTAPLRARASADKVAALLANLQQLQVSRRLDPGTGFYDRYGLSEGKALHVVAETAGPQRVAEFFAGQSSEQGQLIRLPDAPGLFALVNEGPRGYQGFLYTRDPRGWREPTLWSFDEADVAAIEIANPHGRFNFTRRDGRWEARRERPDGGSTLATWPRFDGHRVDELLHAYHALAADDFGGAHERAGAGVDGAETTGGVVRVHLRDTPKPLVLRVGRLAPPGSRFAIPGGRWAAVDGDADGLYVLSPWTARWATADARMFERAP